MTVATRGICWGGFPQLSIGYGRHGEDPVEKDDAWLLTDDQAMPAEESDSDFSAGSSASSEDDKAP